MKTIKILVFITIFGIIALNTVAQQQKVKAGYGVAVAQTEPEFPGGKEALAVFMHDNLKYPRELIDTREGGRVIIMFVINKDGKVVDPIVMQGVNTAINEEAIRVVKMMPDWKPAAAGGISVSKQYILPIDFVPPSI